MNTVKFCQILFISIAINACGKNTSPDTQTQTQVDLTSPIVLSSTPSGILAAGSQNTRIELQTNEVAQCQYDTQANMGYESMTLTFDNTNSTAHSFVMNNPTPGEEYAFFVRCKDEVGNINTSDYTINFSIEDITKPVRSNGSPNDTLPADTTSANLTLITNKEATCKYDVIANTRYDQLSNTFSLTGNKLHGTTLSGLIEGSSQTYYVRCQDADGNTNESDYAIRFLIADASAPTLSQGTPTANQLSGTQSVTLQLNTDEAATCKYSTTADTVFAAMTNALTADGNTHRADITGLEDGGVYQYFARCEDAAGNFNESDYVIRFSITDASAPILSQGSPTANQLSGTQSVTLQLNTDEAATCKYSTTADTVFAAMTNAFSADGNTHRADITGLKDGGVYQYFARCEDAAGNTNESDYPIHFSITDASAPILSQGTPTASQSSGTQSLTLQLNTDETAICKYSTIVDTAFAAMTNALTADGNTHSADITGLEDGVAYQYYARCEDIVGNANDSDYLISFNVANPLDLTAPVISNGLPAQALATDTEMSDISVMTDENAVCKYDIYSGRNFETMSYTFNSTGLTSHSTSIPALTNGFSYDFYVRCQDLNDNINETDYRINFSVLGEVATGTPWSYPAIPYTDWAYNPFTIQLARPDSWPATPAQDYYFVEPDHPMATDVQDGDELRGDFGRFGYPDKPRISIPSRSWITDEFTAGTVIWMKGGIHSRDSFRGLWSPQFHGTAEKPIWFYGDPLDKPTFEGVVISMYNSAHVIFDNLQWIGGNRQNTLLLLTRDRAGPTHHVTLRNLHFENLNWILAGGAIIALTAGTDNGNELHDVVAYKNTFKNNGGGFDWNEEDGDHHAYKVNGIPGENGVYRIWIIENRAVRGDEPDPLDGLYKSISGNLVQVGDMTDDNSGDNHHVYVAGNYQEFARQALGWTKRSSDVIFSSNICTDTYALAGGNGQCYGHQYALGSYNWWINNIGRNSASGWMHTSNDNMTGPLFIVGNLFYNNKKSEADDGWRVCSGITLFNQRGKHYITNNIFDNSCYGIWAQNNRHDDTHELHIYNNIFSNISGTIDPNAKALALENTGGISIFVENNLFDNFNNSSVIGQTHATITDLNAESWAANNIEGNPVYLDQANRNYNISPNSPAVDSGTQSYNSGAQDVYQQFIDRYTNDPNYPGDPRDYWPKDFLKQPRVNNGIINIGPYEN